jgi:DNA gyrase subunit B
MPWLRITTRDERPGREQQHEMCYKGGIREFVQYLNRSKTQLHEQVIYVSGSRGDSMAEVALQYNDSYNETIYSFANNIHTAEGGMHETGLKLALTRALNEYGRKTKLLKRRTACPERTAARGSRHCVCETHGRAVRGQTKASWATRKCARS